MRLAVRKKIQLNLRFSDFKEFEVLGSIVRKSPGEDYVYGIKFDRINNSLADHILKTQRRLKFK
jgi:hypothetical protein